MPLVVVPLGKEDVGRLSVAEWDLLVASERVLFERPDHPLAARLRDAGVEAGPFDDEPAASRDGWALVADPNSPRIVELAREGARVTAGPTAEIDPLTAAHGSYLVRRAPGSLGALALVMARLRGSDGCPWDREQTHESLRVHLIEEAHEVLEAIDKGEVGEGLEEELGDLLLQVAFHAQLAADDHRFDIADVADRIVAKLVHRHPHVFAEAEVESAADVVRNWESIKAGEKDRSDPFAGIPATLSALLHAYKSQKRAAPTGFSPAADDARKQVLDALESLDGAEQVGSALFWLVALARAQGIDPEGALRSATARWRESLPDDS